MKLKTMMMAIALACGAIVCVTPANAAVIRDFEAGIGPQVNHPDPGAFGTWYDITSDAFAFVDPETLDGSPAAKIGDGGFTNGVYFILENVIPVTGVYDLSAAMKVVENTAQLNSIRAYQMGVVVNGAHRPPVGDLAAINPADPGSAIGDFVGLTAGDDNALATQIVTTGTFSATAGDDLLVAFSTDLTSGNFDLNSATWGAGAGMLVDNLTLTLIPEPASIALLGLGLIGCVALRRRSA